MVTGESRPARRFYNEQSALEPLREKIGQALDADAAFELGLVTSNPDADRKTFDEHARRQGIAAINVPARVLIVGDVPVLGTGKTDFRGVEALVEASES